MSPDSVPAHPDGVVSVPLPGMSAHDRRIAGLANVPTDDLVSPLTQRLAQAQLQSVADGVLIARLIKHIKQIDPDDQIAAQAEADAAAQEGA